MQIRKYTAVFLLFIILTLAIGTISYQYFHSMNNTESMEVYNENFRFTKINGDKIELYKDGKWEETKLRGVELSSFTPGYGRYKTNVEKELVMEWLGEIAELNVNVIKIPYVQSPSFYSAIYDYNENALNPIYTIHEVMLDEREVLRNYDIYNKKIKNNFKRDIKNTINVIHGEAILFNSKRSHSGIYLKDISKYNIGYILGTNTNPETVTLSDLRHSDKNSYDGKYLKLEKGSPFEAFVAESIDYATNYELKKYKQLSLMSYLTDVEIDPLTYKHESNQSSYAKVNIENIESKQLNNLFVAYRFHPNSVDFLEHEYDNLIEDDIEKDQTDFYRHLKRVKAFYEKPVLISDTGISSSRGISKVDTRDGFNRGGFSEVEQGKNLVKLLDAIEEADLAGVLVRSWQDDWTSLTSLSNVIDYLDDSASSYWFDTQSSDESFGLISFEEDEGKENIVIDGEFEDWAEEDYIIDDEISLKVRLDASYLYMYLEKEDWSLNDEKIYLGLDITPKSGSDYWEKEEASFNTPVDFIVHLNGYNESRMVVNERYNIFNYLYKYYSNTIDKQNDIPERDSSDFSAIYLLNRKKFYFSDRNEIIKPIYYETGKLTYGSKKPGSKQYNSLADFNKEKDQLEMRIPWTLLNIKNPIEFTAYDDFYIEGVEKEVKIGEIGFSIYDKNLKEIFSPKEKYKINKQKRKKHRYRFKESYHILKKFWSSDI